MPDSPKVNSLDEEKIRLHRPTRSDDSREVTLDVFSPLSNCKQKKSPKNLLKCSPPKLNGRQNDSFCLSSIGDRPSSPSLYAPNQSPPPPNSDTCLSLTDDEASPPPPKSMRHYRRSPERLVVAFLFLFISAFLNFFLLVVVHDIVPRYDALPDLVFMIIPQQRWAWPAGDILSFMASTICITLLVFHKYRWIAFRRAFALFGIMFGLRSLCLGTTFLPPSFDHRHETCFPQNNWTQVDIMDIGRRFMSYMVTMGLTSGQHQILCGDLMFSGHTIVFSMTYFFASHYSPARLWFWLRFIMLPCCYVGMVFTVISGGHYTIDMLIAYWLASHVFWSYHQIFEQPHKDRIGKPLTNVWWYYVCHWLESDVPDGPVPNHIDWPLPWPQFAVDLFDGCDAKLQPKSATISEQELRAHHTVERGDIGGGVTETIHDAAGDRAV